MTAIERNVAGVQRQQGMFPHGFIAQEHDRLGRRLPGQAAMFGAGQHADVGARTVQDVVEPEQRGDGPDHGTVDVVHAKARPRGRSGNPAARTIR